MRRSSRWMSRPAEVRQIPLALQSADLAYRGCSRRLPARENAPQVYDHADVTNIARSGRRCAADSRATVRCGSCWRTGMTSWWCWARATRSRCGLRCRRTPVPEGWKRDFILHSIGYDKDADLNTIYGQTVEPLPFRAMRSYPFGPDEAVPDSPAYREYLLRYQTREQDPNVFWRRLMLPARP